MVVADDRAQAERVGAGRAGRSTIDRGLEDPVGLEVLGQVDEQALGGEAGAIERCVRVVDGRQAARLLVERGRVEGRAAQPGVLGGLGEGCCDGLVRTRRPPARDGGRARPADGVAAARASCAARSSAGDARLVTACANSGWVNRTAPSSMATRWSSIAGWRSAANPGARPFQRVHRRLRGGGGEEHRPARRLGQQRDAGSRSASPRLSGIGQRLVRSSTAVSSRISGPAELERVQRVAARRLLDPDAARAAETTDRAGPGTADAAPQGASARERRAPAGPPGARPGARPMPASRRPSAPSRACRWAGRRAAGARRRGSLRSSRRATGRRRSRSGPAVRPRAAGGGPRPRRTACAGRATAAPGSIRSSATPSAWRCGPGSWASVSSSTPPSRSVSPPSVSPCSACAGRERQDEPPAGSAALDGGLPDGRLPDAGLALEDERRQPAGPRSRNVVDGGELVPPPDDLVRHADPPALEATGSSSPARRCSNGQCGRYTKPFGCPSLGCSCTASESQDPGWKSRVLQV